MIRRKIIKKTGMTVIALFAMLSGMFQSCNFLDIDPYIVDTFHMDSIFVKKEYVRGYLNNVYSYLVDYGSFRKSGEATMPYTLITDECITAYGTQNSNHNYNVFQNNAITSSTLSNFDRWAWFYEGIRRANTFLMRVDECQEVTVLQRREWRGEALFVKAMIYFELMLAWGPVPIVPEEPVSFDTPIEELQIERNTWDQCSDYVEGLLTEAISLLPEDVWDTSETGKATKKAARAVLSRLLLYTASPLYNGQNQEFLRFANNAGVPYLNPEFSRYKWAKAAAAAKALVDRKPNDLYTVQASNFTNTPPLPVPAADQAPWPDGVGGIDPYHSYLDMFNCECTQASANCEILFSRQTTDRNNFNRYNAPGMIFGYASFYIPQNLVDAYYMADGRDYQSASPAYPYEETGYTARDSTWSGERERNGFTLLADTRKWYANREMRFYATVTFNNSYFPSTSTPTAMVDITDKRTALFFADRRSGRDNTQQTGGATEAEAYPMTGYLCRKFLHYEDAWASGARRKYKYAVEYRMAEVFLNYVEAMNELDDQVYTVGDASVYKDRAEMKRCFNLIRHRAGLPGITDADVNDYGRMKELIERERQIELAWEGRRYFDLRRTKRAVIFENADVIGCDVSKKMAEREAFYVRKKVNERSWIFRTFTDRQTFFPIPKSEIDKNTNLDQFPGY
jgi:hypothetical protein